MKTDMDPREDMLRAYAEAAKTGVHHPQSAAVAIAWAVGEIDRLRGPIDPIVRALEARTATGGGGEGVAAFVLAHTHTLITEDLRQGLDRAVREWKEGRR